MTEFRKIQKRSVYFLSLVVGIIFGHQTADQVSTHTDIDLSDLVKAKHAYADTTTSDGGDGSGEGDCSGCDGSAGNGDYP